MASKMNSAQLEAVEHDRGPMLVLAGAGSGKTLVVTHRIARLIERGTPPRAILAMTFTNKAAQEMQQRIGLLVGKRASELTISTFHSFGLRVLTAEAKAFGFVDGKFAIFDQADQASAVREILRTICDVKRYDVWAIVARISKAKNNFVAPEALRVREGDDYDEIAKLVYPRYVEALRAYHAFDFDDLICEVVNLFRRRADTLERWRKRYWYLLVDEYQDTNHAQLELVRLLGGEHRNVCVVGDDDQSIYAWRGADVNNILDFERHFEGAKVVKLQHNYRSTEAILSVANAIIHSSEARRHEKSLIAARGKGEPVQLVAANDPEVEAAFVADEAAALVQSGQPYRSIAVLYRSNNQSELIETALRQRELPYRLIGGTQFYERKEVKDLIAYLRVALHPRDEVSLRRIINYPARGIGPVALEKLTNYALARSLPLWDAVCVARTIAGMPPAAAAGCEALVKTLQTAASRLSAGDLSADVARSISSDVGLEADIIAGSASNNIAARRRGNLEALLRVLERHDRNAPTGPQSLDGLLRLLMLRTEDDESEDPGNVMTLTTVHGAKGLEFENVFIIGAEEGIMPHARTLDGRATDVDPQDVEEERRLFYVAVTRAKSRLYICRSKQRLVRGKPVPRTPSRFLSSIPAELTVERDVRQAATPSRRLQLEGVAGLLAMLDDL